LAGHGLLGPVKDILVPYRKPAIAPNPSQVDSNDRARLPITAKKSIISHLFHPKTLALCSPVSLPLCYSYKAITGQKDQFLQGCHTENIEKCHRITYNVFLSQTEHCSF
jgi:hypothetical protein